MPAILAMLLPIVLPMIVSAVGGRLTTFRAASHEEQRATVRAVLQSKAMLAAGGPPVMIAARQAAKSATVVDAIVAAIAQHGDAALSAANVAAQAKLRKAAPVAATVNPRGPRAKVKAETARARERREEEARVVASLFRPGGTRSTARLRTLPIRNHHLRPGDWVEDHRGRRGSVVKAYPLDRYDVSFVGYGGRAIQLRGEYLTKINPKRNPDLFTAIVASSLGFAVGLVTGSTANQPRRTAPVVAAAPRGGATTPWESEPGKRSGETEHYRTINGVEYRVGASPRGAVLDVFAGNSTRRITGPGEFGYFPNAGAAKKAAAVDAGLAKKNPRKNPSGFDRKYADACFAQRTAHLAASERYAVEAGHNPGGPAAAAANAHWTAARRWEECVAFVPGGMTEKAQAAAVRKAEQAAARATEADAAWQVQRAAIDRLRAKFRARE